MPSTGTRRRSRNEASAFAQAIRYQRHLVASLLPKSSPKPPPVVASKDPVALQRWHWLALAGVTVLAAWLRLACVGDWSLWIDEAHTWRDATMPFADFLDSDRKYYPLTFLLARALLALGWISQEASSLRLPFVWLGIVTVPLMGLCGRRLVGTTAAVVAALLLAIDPWHVYWSQNARGYVVVVLAAVVATDLALAYLQQNRLRDLVLLWGAIGVGTLSHPTGVLFAFGFLAFLAVRHRELNWRTASTVAVVAIVILTLTPWLVRNFTPFEGFVRSKSTPSLLHFLQTTGYYFRPIVLVMAVVGLGLLRHVGGRDRAFLLGWLVAVPLLVLSVIGATEVQVTARYAICILPIVTWLCAFAAMRVGRAVLAAPTATRWARVAMAAVLPLLVGGDHGLGLVGYYSAQHGQRARWNEASAFLLAEAAGRPVRVSSVNHPTMLYYLRPGAWTNEVPPTFAANRVVPLIDWMVAQGMDENKVVVHEPGGRNHVAWHRREARATSSLFAFVVTKPELAEQDPEGHLRAAIAGECRLALHLPCWVGPKDDSIYVYVLKEP